MPGPAHPQDEIARRLVVWHGLTGDDARRLRALYRTSGIRSRHSCLSGDWFDGTADESRRRGTAERLAIYEREAADLAERASRELFGQPACGSPADVDHLLVVSCTGMTAPGLDVELVKRIGLRHDIGRSLIGFQGCQGGLSALRLADRICRAEPASRCLILCVELCSLHFQPEPTEDNFLANTLFADGAAAAFVTGSAHRPAGPALRVDRVTTQLFPDHRTAMSWRVGDCGFELRLSAELPGLIGAAVRDRVAEGLAIEPEHVRENLSFAVHPGGPAILDAVERAFELPREALQASREVLRRYGNMSSPTIFFVLRSFLDAAATDRDTVALGFGPGLSVEAVRFARAR